MLFGVVTIFPEMFDAITEVGVTGRAVKNGLVTVTRWNPREFAENKHRNVDDRPFGGGPGMVMMVQPLRDAIHAAKAAVGDKVHTIYLSPQGRPLDQATVTRLSGYEQLVLVCGRYEGIDERLIETEIDEEISVGDYVLSGGELAAMIVMDAVIRLQPGALGHELSAEQDSFVAGLLDCPHYTRPEVYEGKSVPEVLLSGNHEHIRQWRLKQALGRTWLRRPDLLERVVLNKEQQKLLEQFKIEHQTES